MKKKARKRGHFSRAEKRFMQLALRLAQKGMGFVAPNPLVGAVLVRRGRIIGQGYHRKVGFAHAEIEAIRDAKRKGHRLQDASLYVTLEPCCHTGRTPPCTRSILEEGIRRVIVATVDPNPMVSGKGIAELKRGGVAVRVGLLEEEANAQNEIYRHWMRQQKPFVCLKMSISLDGKISPEKKRKGKPYYLIGKRALRRVHEMRQGFDAICVGIRTLLQDDPHLTTRLPQKNRSHPMPVILDRMARTPLRAKILKPMAHRRAPLIVVGKKAPGKRIQRLRARGAQILQVKESSTGLDLRALLKHLARLGITSLMVEGGSQVAWSFLSQNLVNRLDLAIAPITIGPKGVPMLHGQAFHQETQVLSPGHPPRRPRFARGRGTLLSPPPFTRSFLSRSALNILLQEVSSLLVEPLGRDLWIRASMNPK